MTDIMRAARERFADDPRCDAMVKASDKYVAGRCFRSGYSFIDSGHGFDGRLYCKQHAKLRRDVAGGTIRSL